jgi:hypothetical protein
MKERKLKALIIFLIIFQHYGNAQIIQKQDTSISEKFELTHLYLEYGNGFFIKKNWEGRLTSLISTGFTFRKFATYYDDDLQVVRRFRTSFFLEPGFAFMMFDSSKLPLFFKTNIGMTINGVNRSVSSSFIGFVNLTSNGPRFMVGMESRIENIGVPIHFSYLFPLSGNDRFVVMAGFKIPFSSVIPKRDY